MEREEEIIFIKVSQEIKEETINRIYRLFLLTEVYVDNKKALKHVEKIARLEEKRFKKKKFQILDDFRDAALTWIEDAKSFIRQLRKASTIARYNQAKERLRALIARLRKELSTQLEEEIHAQ